ncbi:hypothetical protein AAMO2058_000527000 [Amorphochlora amoebiformis]
MLLRCAFTACRVSRNVTMRTPALWSAKRTFFDKFQGEGSDNVLTETPETRDAVELKIKEIIVDVSTQIDSDNPFESKATRAKVLDQSIQATGINIPSVDLASIRSQEDLVEYIWARLGSSEESQETNDRGDLTEEIDLPENLKLS